MVTSLGEAAVAISTLEEAYPWRWRKYKELTWEASESRLQQLHSHFVKTASVQVVFPDDQDCYWRVTIQNGPDDERWEEFGQDLVGALTLALQRMAIHHEEIAIGIRKMIPREVP